jgi:hypothetical protein
VCPFTKSDVDAVLVRAQHARIQSLFLRLDAAVMKCQLAKYQGARTEALLASAQQTLNDMHDYIWRTKLDQNHFDQISAKIERLRFEIQIARYFLQDRNCQSSHSTPD